MKRTWLIDSGHGGMIDGIYQTSPAKMFTHVNKKTFYEGVYNRLIKEMLISRMKDAGLRYIDLCPTELDLLLYNRVQVANSYHQYLDNCVILSLHSNSGGGTGFEVFAHPGSIKSKRLGNMLGEQLKYDFPNIIFRKNDNGEYCKTEKFYILTYSYSPAILVECLFFDNWNDYRVLIDPDFQNKYVRSLIQFMLKAELVAV